MPAKGRSRLWDVLILGSVLIAGVVLTFGVDDVLYLAGKRRPAKIERTVETGLPRRALPAITTAPEQPFPHFGSLVYRETVFAGLNWLYGIPARALDGAEARLELRFEVMLNGKRERPGLFIAGNRGEPARISIGADSGWTVLRELPAGNASSGEAAAKAALEDLPRVLKLFKVADAKPLPAGPAVPPRPWSPGGVGELAVALEPLRQPGAGVPPAHLARAARALGWQALFDYRLAPVVATRRASQAMALAAVAERRAGTPLPEAASARWLAQGAGMGDFVLFAARPPPDDPELKPIHESYRDVAPPRAGAVLSMPQLVAAFERALAIDDGATLARLADSVRGPHEPLAWSYLVTCLEFSVVARLWAIDVAAPLVELAKLPVAATLEAAARRALDRWVHDPDRQRRGAWTADATAALVELVRSVRTTAATAPEFADRVVLEEVAERALHGLASVDHAFWQYGWVDESRALDAGLARSADWKHPQLHWLLAHERGGGAGVTPGRRKLTRQVVAGALAFLPGLFAREGRLAAIVGGRELSRLPAQMLALYEEYPGMTLRAANLLLTIGQRAGALELYERVIRAHGTRNAALWRVPLVALSGFGMRRWAARAPAEFRTPRLEQYRAWARDLAGDPAGELAALSTARREHPDSEVLMNQLVRTLARQDRLDEVALQMQAYRAARPPGLDYSMTCIEVARAYRRRGRFADAVPWAAQAAESRSTPGHQTHALALALAGRWDAARREVDELERHYRKQASFDALREVVELLAAKGARSIDALAKLDAQLSDDRRMDLAAALREGGIAFPRTPAGRRLAGFAALRHLVDLAHDRRIAPADLTALAAIAADGAAELADVRRAVSRTLGWLIGSCLYPSVSPKFDSSKFETILARCRAALGPVRVADAHDLFENVAHYAPDAAGLAPAAAALAAAFPHPAWTSIRAGIRPEMIELPR